MIHNELICTIFVYGYVALLLVILGKVLKEYIRFNKTISNIQVKNILSISSLFATVDTVDFFKVA
jgi:hypothetical protein